MAERRPDIALSQLRGTDSDEGLLIVGPSLGTAVADLWSRCASYLPSGWQVVGWDLPGHGHSPAAVAAFTVDELAAVLRARLADLAADRAVAYAGVSLGGAVGFALAADPGPFDSVITMASARRIGSPDSWHERAALVRQAGTSAMVEGSASRWFAPGFLDRDPDTAGALLMALREVDDESYALACEALATYDVQDRVATVPLLVVGGALDVVVPPSQVDIAIHGVAHLPPAEAPAATAELITNSLEEHR